MRNKIKKAILVRYPMECRNFGRMPVESILEPAKYGCSGVRNCE